MGESSASVTEHSALRTTVKIAGLFLAAVVIGLLSSTIHPLASVGAVLVVSAIFLGFFNPFFFLILFVELLLLRPGDFFPALAPLQPAKMAALGAVGVWVFNKLLKRDASLARVDHNLYLFLLTIAVLLSCLGSTNRGASIAVFTENFLKIIVVFVLITNLVNTPKRAVFLHQAIAMACVFLGACALYFKLSSNQLIEGSRVGLVGLLGDPNDLAFVLLMGAPYLAVAAIESKGKSRFGHAAALVVVLGGIIATQSRGGLLGLLAAFYFVFRDRLKYKLATGLALGLLGVLLIMAGGYNQRSMGAVGQLTMDESAQGRLDAWKAGGRMFVDHPFLGVGLDMFSENYMNYSGNLAQWTKIDTHNTYIKIAAETGLLGIVSFLMLMWLSFRNAVRVRRKSQEVQDSSQRAVLKTQLPGLVGIFVASLFLSQSWIWFIYIMIAIAAVVPQAFDSDRITPISGETSANSN